VTPPQAILQVQTAAVDPFAGSGVQEDKPQDQESSFSLGKQAGMVSVYGTERQHEQVESYLDELRRSVTSQVLVEAKILEVSLTDEFATGIDWTLLDGLSGELTLDFSVTGVRPNLSPASSPNTDFQIGYAGNDIQGMVEAISRFGTVRALASPRMTVLNNQSAVLNVANNSVYFEIDIDITQDGGGGSNTSVDSEIKNVPEGVLINVQPSINLDDRTISMAIRPTITRIVDTVNDPAVAFLGAGIDSEIPIVNVQEMDSVIKMGSGQVLVLGGLMQDRVSSTQQGIPVLSEIPMFGGLFRNQSDNIEKSELVIFIRARIVEDTNLDIMDKDLYRMFSSDRRPLNL
jgi:general secretion pathway protein D